MKSHLTSVCPSGSYLNADNNNACEVCPVDTYGSGTNANSCNNCQSGTNTQGQTGRTDVSSCGKWNLIIISEPYIFIIKNISLLSGNKIYKYFSILVCPAGSFLNADNGGTCEVCPVNKYSTTTNSASCMDCPAGTNTQQQIGQVNANACGK